ncbi:MAG: hypothetical protein AAF899_01110 [Pseudomonadota bacterium]
MLARPTTVIATHGRVYGGDSLLAAMDHQVAWLKMMLRFMGIGDISKVMI